MRFGWHARCWRGELVWRLRFEFGQGDTGADALRAHRVCGAGQAGCGEVLQDFFELLAGLREFVHRVLQVFAQAEFISADFFGVCGHGRSRMQAKAPPFDRFEHANFFGLVSGCDAETIAKNNRALGLHGRL